MVYKILSIAAISSAMVLASVAGAKGPVTNNARGNGSFELALIGDAPYGVAPGADSPRFDRIIDEINSEPRIQWVLHAGDIKNGGSNCSDAMFQDRLHRYNQFRKPVVYTPGDNEWTDCHRFSAGGWDPLERLAKLRSVFFGEPGQTIGGRTMSVEYQSEAFPENVRWSHQGVVFTTVHIVGSENATRDFSGRSADDDKAVNKRTRAGIAWLNKAFDRAEAIDAPGVFVMIHANPDLERSIATDKIDPAFLPFLTTLESRTREFDKPVVLAHGDSHHFRVDKPALPRAAASTGTISRSKLDNFTRVETFGSNRVHWVRVSVDPKDSEVFSFEQEVIEAN